MGILVAIQTIDELIESVNEYMDKYPIDSVESNKQADRERIISGTSNFHSFISL